MQEQTSDVLRPRHAVQKTMVMEEEAKPATAEEASQDALPSAQAPLNPIRETGPIEAETPPGEMVNIETVSMWDGKSKINSLEASNGVTKCRGVIFAPNRPSFLNSFSYFLRITRGNCVAFKPIVAVWDPSIKRATEILHQGDMICATSKEGFEEFKYTVPADTQLMGGVERPLMVGFWSEECTEHRSASAELGQLSGLVAEPPIRASVYLNGRMLSGTWREYDSTLVGSVSYTPIS